MVNLIDNVRFIYAIVTIVLLQAVTFIARGFIPLYKFAEKKGTHWTTLAIVLAQVFMISTVIFEVILFDNAVNKIYNYIGWTIYLIILILTYLANRNLGEYYSPKIEVKKKHKLIDFGAYKLIRHPMDLAGILFMIGLPLLASAYFALLWLIPYIVIVLFKIMYEESLLSEKLKGYKNYMKKTKKLLPFIY